MNIVAVSQRLLITLWVLLAASPAQGFNLLHIRNGTLLCARARYDMWGVEQSDWYALGKDDIQLAADLKLYAGHGINTVGLRLQDSGQHEPFFGPGGRPLSPEEAKRFTGLIGGIRRVYLGAVISLFSAEPEAWLASPDAYREAARQVAALIPEHHSTVLVVGDLFRTSPWQPGCPYPLNDLNNVIELGRLIKKARPDCLIGVPANIVPGASESELLYIASKPDELATWADALRTGQDPRKKTGNVVAIQADRFFLRRDVKGDDAAALSQYAKQVAKKRMAMQDPTSAPSGPQPHPPAAELADGWLRLFDGRSLQGWTTLLADPGAWVVEDGALTCRGGGGAWLRTRRQFGDFRLRLEFRIAAKGNSGIFLRAPLDGRASRFGMEMQIRGTQRQRVDDDTTGAIYAVLAPLVDAGKPAGEWNEVEITCLGPKVTIHINGQLVQNFDMDQVPKLKHRLRRGVIGLQDHGNKVSFRNIRIKPLD